ncbi:unnamed protein product [Closterium sp. NIES-53]
MEVVRTSMIHAAAPHFLWPFDVRYAVHQLNLWPRVSEPETSPTLRWTGKVGDASLYRVWGALFLVRDAKANKLSSRTLCFIFLGFPTDAPPWQLYHPRERRVFSSQDVTFDDPPPVDPLPPQGPAPSGVSQVDPPSLVEPLEISSNSSGPAEGGDLAVEDTAATRRSPRLDTPLGFPPWPSLPPPQHAGVDSGVETAGAEPGGPETEGQGSGGAATGGAGSGGAATGGAGSWGAATGVADSGGAASPSGDGAVGDPARGRGVGQPPQPDLFETLLPLAIRAWIVRRGIPGGGGYGPVGAGAASPGGTAGAGGTGGTAEGTRGAAGAGGAGAISPSGATGNGGAGHTSPGGTTGAGGAAGAGGDGAGGSRGAGASGPGGARTGGAGAAGAGGAVRAGGSTGAAGSGGAGDTIGAGGAGAGGTGGTGGAGPGGSRSRGARATGAVGAAGAGGAGGATGAVGTASAGGTACARGPGTARARYAAGAGGAGGATAAAGAGGAGAVGAKGAGAAGSAPPRRFFYPKPQSMALRPSSVPQHVVMLEPSVSSLPHVTDPESDLARAASPTVTHLLATVITDPHLKSTDRANIVIGMWIFRVKQPPGSSPAFKACYVARGFSQRQGVDFFQTFSSTPKMINLRVLLHVAAHRDYELHSFNFSAVFLQGSLHEEIWLRRPPGFTRSFPAGTQWSLRRPVYGLRQAPREWHDTLRTTQVALGFAPSTADPSLFLHTDTTLPPFYILMFVNDFVFATADTEALALVKAELQERHTCTNLGELRSYLNLQITRDRARRTITLTQSHMVHQVLQRFGFRFSSPQPTPVSTNHSLSAPPSDESVELSGMYPELVGCLMYLMTCTRPDLAYPLSLVVRYVAPGSHRKGTVVPTGHSDDEVTQCYTGCEAEIYAGAMATQELRWLTYLLTNLGERPRSPPVMYVNNKAMLALCHEQRLEHRTKHIALRYFLARKL